MESGAWVATTRGTREWSARIIPAPVSRDLTELVRALVDTRRDANVVQFPEEPPEVAESTPSRPLRSGSRLRNPSPTGGRGSDRTRRESPRWQLQERADPSRVRSRSRHSQATRSAAVVPPAATGGMPGDRVRETINVRGSTTSVFDRLGRPGVHRRIGQERSVDKPAKDEDYNQNRLDQLQRQLDQLVGQQYGMDQLGAVAPPFTPFIMASPYPTSPMQIVLLDLNRGSSPVVPEASPRVDRLLQAAGRRLRSRVPKLEDQEAMSIPPVESCTDETLKQAFREGIKDARLVWTLAYDRPPTFAQLRGIAWRHAETDEYVRGRGLEFGEHSRLPGRKSEKNQTYQGRQDKGKAVVVDRSGSNPSPRTPAGRFQQYTPLVTTIEHVLNQMTGRGLLRDPPPLRADRARRNQNKYYNFHKDVGHDTKDCIQLRDQIELLIRDGHLREFVERIITPAGPSRPAQAARRNPRPSDLTDEQEQEHIVHTIFGGTTTGDTASSRRSYVREARQYARGDGLHLPPSNEVPHRRWGRRVPGKPGGREEVLHGGGQQSVPKGPCPDHCDNRPHGGRSRSPERRSCSIE
ncbi:hypothetical protein TIFTF001_035846 [Ficus carica]|uniref:Uncharacterized protein n=1 Tax=Ficus carica TaxID=3494 RepID=A0AA88JA25_FICCA|nr:hypothetical protein TIFTF001_035846 [Ficus carica]